MDKGTLKIKILTLLVWMGGLLTNQVIAQTSDLTDFNKLTEVLPPTPNASSLGKYGGINVGLNTGTASFSIPLFTYSSVNIQLPISLSYSSNGIKTDEVATRTGMSWNLEAGGVITRTVYGGVDERTGRLLPPPTYPTRNQALLDFLTSFGDDPNRSQFDGEPDLFSFNFGPYNGRFVLDSNKNVVLLNHSALKIEKLLDEQSVLRFKITDPEGIQYYFGSDSARDRSTKTSYGQGCGKNSLNSSVTAWYLSQIIHPNNDTVYLDYLRVGMTYTSGISQTMYAKSDALESCEGKLVTCGAIPNTTCLVDILANMAVLKEIRSTGGTKISFSYIDRKDVADKLLSRIEILSQGATSALKTFQFDYIYSTSTSYLNSYQYDSSFRFRPFLAKLTEYGTNSTDRKVHQFSYLNLNDIPPRLTFAQDHFGYFNGKNNTSLIPMPSALSLQVKFPDATANREIDPAYAGNGLLNKIIYPTGGEDSITYGSNKVYKTYEVMPAPVSYSIGGKGTGNYVTVLKSSPDLVIQTVQQIQIVGSCSFDPEEGYEYDDRHHFASIRVVNVTDNVIIYDINLWPGQSVKPVLDLNAGKTYRVEVRSNGIAIAASANFSYIPGERTYQEGNLDAGGMRVEKVITKDQVSGSKKIKKYLYSQEANPDISSGGMIFEPSYSKYLDLEQPCSSAIPGCTFVSCFYYTLYSSSLNNVYTYAGSPVSYGYVVESEGENFENGGTAHTYTVASDIPGNNVLGDNIPSAPLTSRSWKNGLETLTHAFRIENGTVKTVQKVINHYMEDSRVNQEVKAYVINMRRRNICIHNPVDFTDFEGFDLLEYSHFAKWVYIDTTRTLVYSSDGQQYTENLTVFTYGNKSHAQPTAIASQTSKLSWKVTENYYPADVSYSGIDESARQALIARNIISPVLEQKQSEAGSQKLKIWNKYLVFPSGLVLPKSQQLQIGGNPVENGRIVYDYDQKGRLLEQSKANDVHEIYFWGYGGKYIVAKVVNGSYNIAKQYVDLNVLNRPSSDAVLRSQLQNLRDKMPGSMVTTYTYKDEIGITSETDPAGRTTYYEYDGFGRLKVVKDKDGKILKVFDYQYSRPVTQ